MSQTEFQLVRDVLQHTKPTLWKLGEEDNVWISLRLITPQCTMYTSEYRDLPRNWELPWWGFLWPGGYGIARYVITHQSRFEGTNKLLGKVGLPPVYTRNFFTW